MNYKLVSRLTGVLNRLSSQLAEGTKNTREGKVELTKSDRVRIQREMATLTNRIETLSTR